MRSSVVQAIQHVKIADEFMNDLVENVIVEDIVIEETSGFLD